jgi:hypothetical protein
MSGIKGDLFLFALWSLIKKLAGFPPDFKIVLTLTLNSCKKKISALYYLKVLTLTPNVLADTETLEVS